MKMRVNNLVQGYGKEIIIDDISMEMESGELVTILGPNGCGKSTLIKTLSGIRKPKAGDITIDGESIFDIDRKELSKLISYVPQNYVHGSYTTVYDAVLIGRRPYIDWTYSQEDIDKCIDAILEMKIEKYVDKFVTELSGGQMQRVTISRSIAQDANFFIFDEPTSSFDLKNQLNLMKIMKRIIEKKNACLIVALHDINLAMRYSDKVIVLKDGKVYNSGPAKDVITEKMIFDVYGVKSQIIEDENGIHVHTLDDDDCEFIDLE